MYHSQGRYEEAEPLFEQALAILQQTLPEGHPLIATSFSNLARLYLSQGRYEQAEPLYRQELAILVKAFEPQHPNTQTVLQNVIHFLIEQGKKEEAATWQAEFGATQQGVQQR